MSIVRARGCASRSYDRPELRDLGSLIPNKPKPKKKRRTRKAKAKRRRERRERMLATGVSTEVAEDRAARIDREFAAMARAF